MEYTDLPILMVNIKVKKPNKTFWVRLRFSINKKYILTKNPLKTPNEHRKNKIGLSNVM